MQGINAKGNGLEALSAAPASVAPAFAGGAMPASRHVSGGPTAGGAEPKDSGSMFAGIVQGIASVSVLVDRPGLRRCALQFQPGFADGLQIGASVAVDGVCLTVTTLPGGDAAAFDVMQQTSHSAGCTACAGSSVRYYQGAQLGVGCQHAMESDQVQPQPQRQQPLRKLQRAHEQVRGHVARRRLEFELQLSCGIELNPLVGQRRPGACVRARPAASGRRDQDSGCRLRVGLCRPRTSAIRYLSLTVSFPALRSRARPAQADPLLT